MNAFWQFNIQSHILGFSCVSTAIELVHLLCVALVFETSIRYFSLKSKCIEADDLLPILYKVS